MRKIYKFIMDRKYLLKKLLPIGLLRVIKEFVVSMKMRAYERKPLKKEVFLQKELGVNLIGDVKAEIGLGQSVRLIANELNLSKYPFTVYDFELGDNVRRQDLTWAHKIAKDYPYAVNLFHINFSEVGLAYMYLDPAIWEDRYNIGFWVWELEEFPKKHIEALKFFDEIWTPSEFASNSIRKITSKPVKTIPYHVTVECDDKYDRKHFGLPEDAFLYLAMFDTNSTMSRKNPIGAIDAFKNAFDKKDKSVGLVVKMNNPKQESIDYLESILDGYENVYYISKVMDKEEIYSLIKNVDVFVSLHRSEGFGLVMAEAMLLKTACIATNWSSNIEFMNDEIACMLPYTMTEIKVTDGCYEKGGIWADPDVDVAAKYMKKLKEDTVFYNTMIEKAYESISVQLGGERIASMIENRLEEINKIVGEK